MGYPLFFHIIPKSWSINSGKTISCSLILNFRPLVHPHFYPHIHKNVYITIFYRWISRPVGRFSPGQARISASSLPNHSVFVVQGIPAKFPVLQKQDIRRPAPNILLLNHHLFYGRISRLICSSIVDRFKRLSVPFHAPVIVRRQTARILCTNHRSASNRSAMTFFRRPSCFIFCQRLASGSPTTLL